MHAVLVLQLGYALRFVVNDRGWRQDADVARSEALSGVDTAQAEYLAADDAVIVGLLVNLAGLFDRVQHV